MILDVGLPDASGFEVFKRLRELSDVPVVFLTARSDEIDRVVGLELGADDYVAKPFSPRELVARVRAMLRIKALNDGAGGNFAKLTEDPETVINELIAFLGIEPTAEEIDSAIAHVNPELRKFG